jgi:thiazole synthase ThiGH ThiG subunit
MKMKENFDKLKIGNKFFNSRLMLGTGKYKTTLMQFKVLKVVNVKLLLLLFEDYQLI